MWQWKMDRLEPNEIKATRYDSLEDVFNSEYFLEVK